MQRKGCLLSSAVGQPPMPIGRSLPKRQVLAPTPRLRQCLVHAGDNPGFEVWPVATASALEASSTATVGGAAAAGARAHELAGGAAPRGVWLDSGPYAGSGTGGTRASTDAAGAEGAAGTAPCRRALAPLRVQLAGHPLLAHHSRLAATPPPLLPRSTLLLEVRP